MRIIAGLLPHANDPSSSVVGPAWLPRGRRGPRPRAASRGGGSPMVPPPAVDIAGLLLALACLWGRSSERRTRANSTPRCTAPHERRLAGRQAGAIQRSRQPSPIAIVSTWIFTEPAGLVESRSSSIPHSSDDRLGGGGKNAPET